MSGYKNVLARLVQFRQSLNMTQSQIAEKLNISQEQYSYLENGKIKISAGILMKLKELGLDINYLITETHSEYKNTHELTAIFEGIDNGIENKEMNRMLSYLLQFITINKAASHNETENKNLKLLNFLIKHWDDFTMMQFVRELLGLSQEKMADDLGVAVKKYRKLEKEIIYPDAELIYRLYQMAGYPPELFLYQNGRELYIMELIWDGISPACKIKLTDVFRSIYNLRQ